MTIFVKEKLVKLSEEREFLKTSNSIAVTMWTLLSTKYPAVDHIKRLFAFHAVREPNLSTPQK